MDDDFNRPSYLPDKLFTLQVRIIKTLKKNHGALSMRILHESFDRKYTHRHIGLMLQWLIKEGFVTRYGSKYFPAKYELNNKGRLLLKNIDRIRIYPDLNSDQIKGNVFQFPDIKKRPE